MKLPTHLFLDQQDIPYQRLTFPDSTEKGAANVADVLGYNERQMVNLTDRSKPVQEARA